MFAHPDPQPVGAGGLFVSVRRAATANCSRLCCGHSNGAPHTKSTS